MFLYLFIVNRSRERTKSNNELILSVPNHLWFLNRFYVQDSWNDRNRGCVISGGCCTTAWRIISTTHTLCTSRKTYYLNFSGSKPIYFWFNAPCLKLDARTGTEPLSCRSVGVGEALSAGWRQICWRYSRYPDIPVPSLTI